MIRTDSWRFEGFWGGEGVAIKYPDLAEYNLEMNVNAAWVGLIFSTS